MTVVISETTTFNDWPQERDALGLVVLRTELVADPRTGRQKVVLVLAPETASGEPVQIRPAGPAW